MQCAVRAMEMNVMAKRVCAAEENSHRRRTQLVRRVHRSVASFFGYAGNANLILNGVKSERTTKKLAALGLGESIFRAIALIN